MRVATIVALVYLAAHLPFLPSALEDIDSINFALGLHEFDPVLHRPHPPGYPVYIAAGRLTRAAAERIDPSADAQAGDARALALLSAAGGAASIVLVAFLILLAGRASGYDDAAASQIAPAVLVLATAPLFWMSGLRPLSDMPGLAAALAVQVALMWACVRARRSTPALLPMALATGAAGLALGVRSQILWLTAPLLVATVFCYRHAGWRRVLPTVVGSFATGALAWAIPMVIASGGLARYLTALDVIAGEDFSNVGMLWTNPSARKLAFTVIDTFVRPWGTPTLALVALVPAALGACVLLWRTRGLAGWVALIFLPYLIFHVLFQDTPHTRYALPLLVPIAWALAGLLGEVGRAGARGWATGSFAVAASVAVAIASLVVVVPVAQNYADTPLPAEFAVAAAREGQRRSGGAIGAHFDYERLLSVSPIASDVRIPSPRFGERAELVRYWAGGGRGPVWFVASPARTDVELIDPFSRTRVYQSRWNIPRDWFLGGIRPTHGDLIRMEPPGWIAGEGWHLTREELILSDRRGRPDATMFVARRPGPAVLFLGGERVPDTTPQALILTLNVDGRDVLNQRLPPEQHQFFRRIALPAGTLSGPGVFANVVAAWRAERESAPAPALHLTQFELQAPDRPFWVYSHGWHDREFDQQTDREWRWTSSRAELRVNPAGHDFEIQIAGEVPIADLDGAPVVTISAGDEPLQTIEPRGPFSTTVRVTADALDRAEGVLAIATDRTFVPDARHGSGDRRRLGLRITELRVNPVAP